MNPDTYEIEPATPVHDHTFALDRCDEVPPGLVFLYIEKDETPFMISTLRELGTDGPKSCGWKAAISREAADDIRRRFVESGVQGFSLGAVEIATAAAAEGLGELARKDRVALLGSANGLREILSLAGTIGDRLDERLGEPDVTRLMADLSRIQPDTRSLAAPSYPEHGKPGSVSRTRDRSATKAKRDPAKERARRKQAAKARKKNRR